MRNSEDNLLCAYSETVVVGSEQVSEVVVELVCANQILADSSAISVAVLANINLSIKVQLRKNHLNEALVAAAIYILTLSCKVVTLDKLLTLLLNPSEQISTADLAGTLSAYSVVLSSERHITEQIDSVVVRQSTQSTSLSNQSTLILELNACRVSLDLTDKLVAETYLIENTVVHSNDKLVRCLPVHIVHIGQTSIIPAASSLVSGQTLEVEVSTEVLTETTVNTIDIGATVSTI